MEINITGERMEDKKRKERSLTDCLNQKKKLE